MYYPFRERVEKINKIGGEGSIIVGKPRVLEPTPTPTPTPTFTNTPTNTPTTTLVGTSTPTRTPTRTPTPTFTNTPTRTPTRTPTPTPTPTSTPTNSTGFSFTFIGPGESEFGLFAVTSEFSDTIYYNYAEGSGGLETMLVYINDEERMIIDYTSDRNDTMFGIKLQDSQTTGPQLTALFQSGELFLTL